MQRRAESCRWHMRIWPGEWCFQSRSAAVQGYALPTPGRASGARETAASLLLGRGWQLEILGSYCVC